MANKALIIDLDSILYRAGFSVEKTWRYVTVTGEDTYRARFSKARDMKEWCEEQGLLPGDYEVRLEHEVGEAEAAIKLFDVMLSGIHRTYEDYVPEMYMGGKADYRYEIYPEYKGNRKDQKRPVHYDMLFSHAQVMGAIIPEGIEADDMCCIRAYECMEAGDDYVLARIDKDLAQIPGTHYNFATTEEVMIDPYEADLNFYTQLLTGDAGDNIPGLKGIGKKRAAKILEDCSDEREMYNSCKLSYYDHSGCETGEEAESDMYRNAQLLYLLRHREDTFKPPI